MVCKNGCKVPRPDSVVTPNFLCAMGAASGACDSRAAPGAPASLELLSKVTTPAVLRKLAFSLATMGDAAALEKFVGLRGLKTLITFEI